jgi:Ser/Thr protein kinase RdoA (MazF antagonist)
MDSTDHPIPTDREWLDWHVEVIDELHAGKQSRVFEATLDGRRAVVKLTDAHLADHAALAARLAAVDVLAADHDNVVAPLRIGDELVQPIGDWLMTATPFVTGDRLDVTTAAGADLLGATLADLHRAMRDLPSFDIPPVAALTPTSQVDAQRDWQLLHGDFSEQNVIATPSMVRVFDFDDCGYGPVEYDIANSLYMVLFDSDVNGDSARYERVRPAFLSGYAARSARAVDDGTVDAFIAIRIEALHRWISDLPSAPIGIRTSPPAWLDRLASFVAKHRPSVH